MADLPQVLALCGHGRRIAVVGKGSDGLEHGGEALVVWEPPVDAALVVEELGHACAHCDG